MRWCTFVHNFVFHCVILFILYNLWVRQPCRLTANRPCFYVYIRASNSTKCFAVFPHCAVVLGANENKYKNKTNLALKQKQLFSSSRHLPSGITTANQLCPCCSIRAGGTAPNPPARPNLGPYPEHRQCFFLLGNHFNICYDATLICLCACV